MTITRRQGKDLVNSFVVTPPGRMRAMLVRPDTEERRILTRVQADGDRVGSEGVCWIE